jgi:F-type H+-transporting ATPase subunit epsilon
MIHIKIVTPERTVLEEDASSLSCPTSTGQITVLPNHVPLISNLVAGELVVHVGSTTHHYAVSGGFVEVRPNSEVVILADSAEHSSEIDAAVVELAQKKAEADMASAKGAPEEDYQRMAAAIRYNAVRLQVAKRNPHRGKHGVGSEGVLHE